MNSDTSVFEHGISHVSDIVRSFAGIAGLVISVILIKNPEESNFSGEIVLPLLLVATDAIIGPCFVLLTAAWYADTNGGCIVRLLLWASSYPILTSTIDFVAVAAQASDTAYNAIYAGLAAICILLSVYIFACVDMPGVATWLGGAHRNVRLRGRKKWQRHHPSLPVGLWTIP